MEYALYKGDELLSIGTIREIAKARGVKEDTIKYYGTQLIKREVKQIIG